MDKEQVRKLMEENPTVRALAEEREILWLNPKLASFETARGGLPLSMADVDDAEARLARFAPFIMKKFPETADAGGIIESELREAAAMKERLNEKYGAKIEGRLFVKMDGDLPIAGSIKARGGIYEVLKHTEELALEHGLLREGDSYEKLASDEARKFFSQYTIFFSKSISPIPAFRISFLSFSGRFVPGSALRSLKYTFDFSIFCCSSIFFLFLYVSVVCQPFLYPVVLTMAARFPCPSFTSIL